MPRDRQRACLQEGLKLDLNRLARKGLITRGAKSAPQSIRWTHSYTGQVITSGWISADMQGGAEGWLHIQSTSLTSGSPLLPCPAIMAVDNGFSSAR